MAMGVVAVAVVGVAVVVVVAHEWAVIAVGFPKLTPVWVNFLSKDFPKSLSLTLSVDSDFGPIPC